MLATVQERRRYINRRAELQDKSRSDLLGLARSYWPNYRADGVDDETLIDDILDYEDHHRKSDPGQTPMG
jgi:hypothetical protein